MLVALLASAGCGNREGAQLSAETDDPYYVQGVQLKRQGRNPEALTSFLKVIDKRGERGAPESHFEVGEIYLQHIKEPAYAYYHFRKYLELQPNSPQAELVRGRVGAALREFAKTIPGRATDDQSIRLKANEDVAKLQKEVEQLRAELAVVRGGAVSPNRPAPMITAPNQPPPAGTGITTARVETPISAAPIRPAPAPLQNTVQPGPATQARINTTQQRVPVVPRANVPSGRTHAVKPKETLYAISKQYNVKLEDLVSANGISNPSNVPVGTVLKIPAPATASR